MWRSFLARVLIWFVALAGLGLYATAQTNTGNVYGTVTDEQGSALPGGTAQLTGPAAPQTTTVDAGGQFRFLKVPPGKYSVIVTMPGFTTVTQENVIVVLGRSSNVEIKMRISNVQENVVVSGATPLIDTRKVETGATFSHDELTEIPTARNVWNLIQQVPGVQVDTVDVAGAASAVTGGPDFITKGSGNVSYKVDGSTITDNTYGAPFNRQNGGTNTFFDFDTFQNVEIATGGSLLEQENSGVTINVVTKRGTNELKGSARYNYASHSWQSDNRSQEAIDQGFNTNQIRYIREWGAEVGGPIVKDKLWLWAAGSRQDISTLPTQVDTESTTAAQTVKLLPWNAKLNWQVVDSNALNLFYQRSDRTEDGHISSADVTRRPPETRTERLIPTDFYKIEDNHVFSSDLFASIFLNYQNVHYSDFPPNPNTQIDFYADDTHPNGAWHNSWFTYLAKDPQKQANLSVSKFFTTGSLNHELKVGFNYRQQIADSTTGLPGDHIWGYEYSYSSATALISRGVRTVFKTEFWTGTIGDTITMGNLTLNAGVRYDIQRGRNLPGTSFANPTYPDLLPQVEYHGAPNWQFNYQNWQPRASASYAMGDKKETILRASYGRFADQLGFVSYYGSGVPISNGYYYYWTDTNRNHHVDPGEFDINDPLGRLQRHRPRGPAQRAQQDRARLHDAGHGRVHARRGPPDHQRLCGLGHLHVPIYEGPAGHDPTGHRRLDVRVPGQRDGKFHDQWSQPRLQRALLWADAVGFSERRPALQPAGSPPAIPGRRPLGRQTPVAQLDDAGELRLERFPTIRRARIGQGSQQPLGAGRPEHERHARRRLLLEGVPLHQQPLAVQRHGAVPVPARNQPRGQLLRAAGVSVPAVRACVDA